tara:strand:- start:241 stop:486 length:246 start_codon:yes stop_codon:yes gene_type:complete
MKTKGRELGITEFPYEEYDKNGYITYHENSWGTWWKVEYDDKGNKIRIDFSDGEWRKFKYDDNHNETYYEFYTGHKEYYII